MNEAKKEQITWPQIIEKVSTKFNEIATRHQLVTWAEESQFAKQAIQKNDKLAGCLVHTVQNAVVNVAAVGLTLNPTLGYAYLIPEGVMQSDGKYRDECMLRVSFKGLLKIATDSGSIKWAKAEVVKEHDTFEYCGPCQLPKHTMQPFGARGNTVGAYCIAKTHDGDYLVDIMDGAEIVKIRNAAKTKKVWDAWPDEMTKKAIIKRASKQWPKTDRDDRLDRAIAVVNEHEGSEDIAPPARLQEVPTSLVITEDQAKALRDELKKTRITEAQFLTKAGIETIESLPSNRYAGALGFIKSHILENAE